MPVQPCPACGTATVRLLEDCSNVARVNYYRCEACGHASTTDKTTGAILHHVTPRITPPQIFGPSSASSVPRGKR